MIKKEEIMKLSEEFNKEDEALVYGECKNGTTELILSGGGMAIFYIMRCVLKRLAELRDSTIEDALSMLEYVVNETKEAENDDETPA